MSNKKKKAIIGVFICAVIFGVISLFLYNKPSKIKKDMPGVILNKKTKKAIGNTNVSINLEHLRGKNPYNYKGNMEFKDLNYTKENEVMINLLDGDSSSNEQLQNSDIFGSFLYFYNYKVEDHFEVSTKKLEVTVIDPKLSEFVITNYDNPDSNQSNNDVIIVFPARTEQEALEVIKHFKSQEDFFCEN